MTPKEIIEKRIQNTGLKMTKKISSGGFFSDSTYDNRTINSLNDLYKLTKEGFYIDQDVGLFILNAFLV